MWIFWIPIDVCCVSGPDVQLAKLVVRNVLPCLSNWSLLAILASFKQKIFFFFTVQSKINLFTRSLLSEGSSLQVQILFVCLYVITSTFPFYGLQIIPESCQTPHIIYRWIWCMSGGIRSMSGGVWWCLMHVWWCPVVSMYIDRFELIDVYGQISLQLMLLKC